MKFDVWLQSKTGCAQKCQTIKENYVQVCLERTTSEFDTYKLAFILFKQHLREFFPVSQQDRERV